MTGVGLHNPSGRRPQYAMAAAWAGETYKTLRASCRTAWIAAAGASVAALLLGWACAALGPLRAAAPFAVAVERQGGYAVQARRLSPGRLTSDPAMIDAFLAQYVAAREGFSARLLQANVERIALWSDARARDQFYSELGPDNPARATAVYTAATTVTPVVKSVSHLSPTQALVRFDTVRRDGGLTTGEQRGWQAVVTFHSERNAVRNRDRFDNPLGFRVADYRREPDTSLPAQVSFPAPQ